MQQSQAVFAELLNYSNERGYFVPLYVPMNNFASDPAVTWTPRADGLYDFSSVGVQ